MKILCLNTESGLVPVYASDVDDKHKLAIGHKYWCDVKRARNYEFHKKFFALIKLAFDNLPEGLEKRYPSSNTLRDDLLIRCGYTERVNSRQGPVDVAASIAFDKMGQDEFEQLYTAVWNEIARCFVDIGQNQDNEDVKEELIRFL